MKIKEEGNGLSEKNKHFSSLENELEIKSFQTPLLDSFPYTLIVYENQLVVGWLQTFYAFPLGIYVVPTHLIFLLEGILSFPKAKDKSSPVIHQEEGEGLIKSPPKDYKGHIREYFERRPYPDVIFKCGDKEIPAHKSIISLRCTFLADLFHQKSQNISFKIRLFLRWKGNRTEEFLC